MTVNHVEGTRFDCMLIVRRHEHYERTVIRREPLRDRQAVDAGHRDVEEHEVRRLLSHRLKRVAAVVTFAHHAHRRNFAEKADHALASGRLVIDDKHTQRIRFGGRDRKRHTRQAVLAAPATSRTAGAATVGGPTAAGT